MAGIDTVHDPDIAMDPTPLLGDQDRPAAAVPARSPRRRASVHAVSVLVLVLALAITATLAVTSWSLHDDNESRLLGQRVREAGAVLEGAIPSSQTPLISGAVLMQATNANSGEFRALMTPLATGRPFVSASVWPTHAADPRPLAVVGTAPDLARAAVATRRSFLEHVVNHSGVSILDFLDESQRRLGYGVATSGSARYVVYAEVDLPRNRRSRVDSNAAFSNLDYAIYLGRAADPSRLLAASVADPRFNGRTASDIVAFGDTSLDIVMTPRGELGGSLLARLPWLIGSAGTALAIAAALLTERLARGRRHAEELAAENAMLFSEQRSVAQTLQHSLLPDQRPVFAGLDLAARYVPGVDGVDVGGDWYDVIDVDDSRVMIVVGDVSGRGLRAATVMASLRYATRAYAVQGDLPSDILTKLSRLINVERDGQFATVLCGLVDVTQHAVTFSSAGHPRPLLIADSGADFVATAVGPPVGVSGAPYRDTTVHVPHEGILLAFTDGLFERRGETIDEGLARLREAAIGHGVLDLLLDELLRALIPNGGNDDVAALAVRWCALTAT